MMMWALCKDCWIKHDSSTLLCRCKQCGVNACLARPVMLESKVGAGAFPRSGPLVCALHPQPEPLDLYCEVCGRNVSPRALIDERGVIALVGDTQSGKTSLLWVLSERMRQHNPRGLYISESLGDSDEQMAKAVRSIVAQGRVIRTAKTDAGVRNYAWEITLPSGGTQVVAFHDAAGELWTELPNLPRAAYDRFYRYLDLAGSIIFTIDGERLSESIATTEQHGVSDPISRAAQTHELTIIKALARRTAARRVKLPIAAVVTKADTVWGDDRWSLFKDDKDGDAIDDAVRGLLRAAGRQPLVDLIDREFAPVRFFAVSAFGKTAQKPLRIEDLRPTRVEEPMLALLEHFVQRS